MTKLGQCTDGNKIYTDIWDAIEPSPEETADMRVRSDLMMEIQRIIRESGWDESEAARRCGISEQRMRAFFSNEINDFTLDNLVRMTGVLGRKLRFEFEAA